FLKVTSLCALGGGERPGQSLSGQRLWVRRAALPRGATGAGPSDPANRQRTQALPSPLPPWRAQTPERSGIIARLVTHNSATELRVICVLSLCNRKENDDAHVFAGGTAGFSDCTGPWQVGRQVREPGRTGAAPRAEPTGNPAGCAGRPRQTTRPGKE